MSKLKLFGINCLLNFYINRKRSYKVRSLLKKLIGNERIQIKYESINLYVGLNSGIENVVLFDEYNEKYILKIINYFASINYNLIDIGANIGLHSLTAAIANTEIEVFSFEPEPDNFYNFIKNISINNCSNIRPFRLGIGNYIGISIMNVNQGWNKGKHSMRVDFGDNQKQINIPMSKLDNFKDNLPTGYLMIKIDVEGFEKEVILGGLKVLSSFENIFLIIELLQETNGVLGCQEIIEILKNNDFLESYKINENGHFEKVVNYQGSSDYFFLKGTKTIKDFKIYREKCDKA